MPDAPARRPLVGVTTTLLLGVAAGLARPAAPGLVIAAAAATFLVALLTAVSARPAAEHASRLSPETATPWRLVPDAAVHIALALLAFAWTSEWAGTRFSGPGWGDAEARLEVLGVVSAEPDARPHPSGFTVWRFPMALQASRFGEGSEWVPDSGTIRVSWATRSGPRPRFGDLWRMHVTPDPAAPFVSRHAAERPALRAGFGDARLMARGLGNPVVEWCLRCRRHAADALARDIQGQPGTSILHALLLGYRSDIPRPVRADFAATGTTHIIAISGLNVGLVAATLIVGLAACGISRERWLIGLAPILVVYTIGTGLSASALRACLMALAFFAAPALGRKPDFASALGLAAVVILAAEPGQLYDVGFILSFVAVLGLIVLYPPLNRIGHRLHRPDPWQIEPELLPRRLVRTAIRHAWSLLAASLAAWLVTAPVIAACFGSLSLIGVLTNFIAVPLSFLIVLGGCLSIFFSACWPPLGIPFNHANLTMVDALTGSMHVLAGIPFAAVDTPPPPAWGIALWYVALAGLAMVLHAKLRVDNQEANP